jgi:hypothetical protein
VTGHQANACEGTPSISRPRSKVGASRETLDCLDVLTGDEALAVLRELVSSHPDLVPDARRAANALLATVSFTDIGKSVLDALLALDLDDLDAGPRAGGYVEPSEAAWKAIEQALMPYFDDLERRVKLRHENEAAELCKGIVLGLYRAEHRGFELLEYGRTARPNSPVMRWTCGNAGAATASFRGRSLRSSHRSGIGSFAEPSPAPVLFGLGSNNHMRVNDTM